MLRLMGWGLILIVVPFVVVPFVIPFIFQRLTGGDDGWNHLSDD